MTLDLSVNHFPVSGFESTLQPIATKFLKRWGGLAKSADTGCLFSPKEKGGLELPSLVTLYKKLQVAKAAAYTCSRDPVVRAIATQETRKDATQTRPAFKPYQVIVAAMQKDPGATSKWVREQAKSRVEEGDTDARLRHSTSLSRQNRPLRDDSRAPQLWSVIVPTLPERVFRFALNSLTDTLPHIAILHLWRRITTPACISCVVRGKPSFMCWIPCPYVLSTWTTAMMQSSGASTTSWLASFLHLRASQQTCQTSPTPSHSKLPAQTDGQTLLSGLVEAHCYGIGRTGHFLSKHVVVKQIESKTFWPQRSLSAAITDGSEGLHQLQYSIVTEEDLRGRNVLLSICFTTTCLLKNCPAIVVWDRSAITIIELTVWTLL